jgi:hypothetical protein
VLVRLRHTEIKRTFPDVRPQHGILRRTMLQALLDTGVASIEDYDDLIPAELKRMTDRRQAEVYLELDRDPRPRGLSHTSNRIRRLPASTRAGISTSRAS